MAKRANKDVNVDIDNTQWQDLRRLLTEAWGMRPKEVNAQVTERTNYYKAELVNLVKGRFNVTCPNWWSKDYLLNLLLLRGRFFVCDSPIGIAPFDGSAHGLNVFNRPSHITVSNHILGEFDRTIYYGLDVPQFGMNENNEAFPYVVVCYLYDDKEYRSIAEMVDIYAQKLANVDASLDVNLLNTRLGYIFNVKSSKQANAAKRFYDKISLGEPAVFIDIADSFVANEKTGRFVETMPVKENYIADKLTELKSDIKNEFLTRIGINNTPYEKRERLLTNEVDSNNGEIDGFTSYMRENLRDCSERVRNLFKIDFSISIKESEGGGVETDRPDGSSNPIQ